MIITISAPEGRPAGIAVGPSPGETEPPTAVEVAIVLTAALRTVLAQDQPRVVKATPADAKAAIVDLASLKEKLK